MFVVLKEIKNTYLGNLKVGDKLTSAEVDLLSCNDRKFVRNMSITTRIMDYLFGFGLIFKSTEFPHPEERETHEEVMDRVRNKFKECNK